MDTPLNHAPPPPHHGWVHRQLNKHLIPALDLAIVRIGEHSPPADCQRKAHPARPTHCRLNAGNTHIPPR